MAKLTRQQQQIFAGQAPSDMIAAFGSTQTGTPVYSTNLSTLQTTNYQQGWQDAIIADKAPFLEEMNGVQYGLSYQIAYNQQMGIPEWLSTQDYYTNSRAMGSDGNIYKSLTDDNVGNNPILDDGTNWVLDNAAVTDVLNYLTNCMLSAPNGIPSYSGNVVTVYESTSFLFPNGRNTDSNTLKNVNFSLASNATGTITGSVASDYYVFVTSDLDIEFIPQKNYFEQTTQPTALTQTTLNGIWYNPNTNILSLANATASTPSWSAIQGALCATLTYDGSAITAFNPIYPVGIANTDMNNLSTVGSQSISTLSAPSDTQIPFTVNASGATYQSPVDGYVIFNKTATSAGQYTFILVYDSTQTIIKQMLTSISGLANGSIETGGTLRVGKNDIIFIKYTAAGTTTRSYIVPTNAFESEGE